MNKNMTKDERTMRFYEMGHEHYPNYLELIVKMEIEDLVIDPDAPKFYGTPTQVLKLYSYEPLPEEHFSSRYKKMKVENIIIEVDGEED